MLLLQVQYTAAQYNTAASSATGSSSSSSSSSQRDFHSLPGEHHHQYSYSIITYMRSIQCQEERQKKVVVDPKAAAAAAARPPQPIEHHAHSCVSCGAKLRCRHWLYQAQQNGSKDVKPLRNLLMDIKLPLSLGSECSLCFVVVTSLFPTATICI